MAKQKNDSPEENNVDLETLQENLKGLEIEKNMLKEQKQRIETEKQNLEEQRRRESEEHAQKVNSLEEKIQKLESENNQLQQDKENLEQQSQQVPQNQPETAELQQRLDKANQENTKLFTERDKWRTEAQGLHYENQRLVAELNKNCPKGLLLSDFVMQFLTRLAEKLSAHFKRDITPVEIVEDYIISYNLTKQWTQIFHPWVDMRKDAIEIAHAINPDIKTLEDLKTALHLK